MSSTRFAHALLFLLIWPFVARAAVDQSPGATADPSAHSHAGEVPEGMEVVQVPTRADTSRAMPRIFLSWGAPFGEPGSRREMNYTCGDTSAVDTLYLSMDPVASRPQFIGWLATLYFKAAPGDTLRPFWRYTTGGPGRSPVRVEVADSRTSMPGRIGWPELQAFGGGFWDHTASSGRLRIVAAVDVLHSPPLPGPLRYTLGAVLVRRPPATPDDCAAPMCVELATIQCTFGQHSAFEPISNQGVRFVGLQDPAGEACGADAATARPPKSDSRASRKRGR